MKKTSGCIIVLSLSIMAAANMCYGSELNNGAGSGELIEYVIEDEMTYQTGEADIFRLQISDVLDRYNRMIEHNGCASSQLKKADDETAAEISRMGTEKNDTEYEIYEIKDCRSVEDVMDQRHKYFSDDVLLISDSETEKYLAEYNDSVYIMITGSGNGEWNLNSASVESYGNGHISASAEMKTPEGSVRYILTFSVCEGYVRMDTMEKKIIGAKYH